MANKFLLIFLLASSSVMAQVNTDTLYTLPISKARLLVRDALRLQVVDSINQQLHAQAYISAKSYQQLYSDMGQLRYNFNERIALYEDSNRQLTQTNQNLRKTVGKEQRKVKGWKVGTIIAFGVGLYLGTKAEN